MSGHPNPGGHPDPDGHPNPGGHPDPGGRLNPGGQQFRADRGAADPQVAAALAAYQAGQDSEQAALTALAAARLLVPVVAVLADGTAADSGKNKNSDKHGDQHRDKHGDQHRDKHGDQHRDRHGDQASHQDSDRHGDQASHQDSGRPGDKNSEMVLPTLIGRDGRRAMLAFTALDALARWRPDARPVPAEADRVWRAAVADDCAVVIDVAGPVPLAVEGARLQALAAGRPVPSAHEDPDLRAEVEAVVAAEPLIAGFSLAPSHQVDLAVRLRVADLDWQPAVNRAANGIAARLAGRLRRGVEFSVTPEAIGS